MRRNIKQRARLLRMYYCALCAVSSCIAVYAFWQMAKASPSYAAILAGCGMVLALARADIILRFGANRGPQH